MTEQELLTWLLHSFPRENEACEWKEFKQLKHAVSGKKGEDLISYISSIANMQGGSIVVGVKDSLHEIVGIQDFHDYTVENLSLRVSIYPSTSRAYRCMLMEKHGNVWGIAWSKCVPRGLLPLFMNRCRILTGLIRLYQMLP